MLAAGAEFREGGVGCAGEVDAESEELAVEVKDRAELESRSGKSMEVAEMVLRSSTQPPQPTKAAVSSGSRATRSL